MSHPNDAHDPAWDDPANVMDAETKAAFRTFLERNIKIPIPETASVGYTRSTLIAYINSTWYLLTFNDDVGGEKSVGVIEFSEMLQTIGPMVEHVKLIEAAMKQQSDGSPTLN